MAPQKTKAILYPSSLLASAHITAPLTMLITNTAIHTMQKAATIQKAIVFSVAFTTKKAAKPLRLITLTPKVNIKKMAHLAKTTPIIQVARSNSGFDGESGYSYSGSTTAEGKYISG